MLEGLLPGLHPCLQLVAQTPRPGKTQEWLALLPTLEGVVAKRSDGRYAPGRRDWVKVKRQRTADCVVIGLAGHGLKPALVLALRHWDANLHHFAVARAKYCTPGSLRTGSRADRS
jgi:ATP-dependent DNA ligase